MSDKHDEKEHEQSHGGGHGPPHGGGAHEEHEGAPEWLISFADNVTLMMGFFVILLAINLKPAGGAPSSPSSGDGPPSEGGGSSASALDMALAVREAFNNPVNIMSTDPNDRELVRRLRQLRGRGYADDRNAPGDEHDVQSIRPGDFRDLGGALHFETDSVKLNADARRLGTELAKIFRGTRIIAELRGHASSQEAFNKDDHGMRLSFERSMAVAAFLVEQGMDWSQIRIIAHGTYDRVEPVTYDNEGHRANARVEVIGTNQSAPILTPLGSTNPKSTTTRPASK